MVAKRSGIVGGYARSWPREIFDLKAKAAREIDFLSRPGVYVLYNDGEQHYIGQAVSMFNRLLAHAHPKSRYYNFWNTFSAFEVGEATRQVA
jgi:excinuclease UvrABC nuclease subunit